ncbi:Tyrosine recombinase XerA [uncultured archaeon]|nr:Tyrosine recombinase XerA [uncultured archaeon]
MENQETINYIATEMQIRNFARVTITSYLFHIESFLDFSKYPIEELTELDVKNYLSFLYKKGKSECYTSTALAACKFLFNGFGKEISINSSKKAIRAPVILTLEEVELLVNNISNLKHRLMIELLYSSGLRLSEVINLKKQDIDFNESTGVIRKGNYKKREFILSQKLLVKLHYYLLLRDTDSIYIFDGPNGRLSKKTVQSIIRIAAKKASLNKRIHPHTLRHSFAAHLLEQGTDLRIIQELLGHNQLKNAEVYVPISNKLIKNTPNPLDSLNLDSDIELYNF